MIADTIDTGWGTTGRRRIVAAAAMIVCAAHVHGAERAGAAPPPWAEDAIWYQVFAPRFCNGDTANDPPGTVAWDQAWDRLAPNEHPPLRDALSERRYGGDLQGLRAKLPYLQELGVNTLYLNPVFEAPSQHKYDTADHRHIDGSMSVFAREDAAAIESPESIEAFKATEWPWNAGDRVFLELLADCHRRGMRVVIDGVFNHVGRRFPPWIDVTRRGQASPYAAWFDVTDWGPPLKWNAWDGPNGYLVRFSRAGDGLHPEVEAYLFAVVRRWMDPNGDGDSSDGVDGWRLDAAEQVPHGFWRRFRQTVKQVNADAIILGEIWTDATPWLDGAQFDVVTNYQFSGPVMQFFAQTGGRESAATLLDELNVVRARHEPQLNRAMVNLLGSHDTERAVTMLVDPVRFPGSADEPIPRRDTLIPDEGAFRRLRLAALFQFTYLGAPLVYYGDEVGMYGGDDPFCRAPMSWPESVSQPIRDDSLACFRSLVGLRKQCTALRRGGIRWMLADANRRLLAFTRTHADGDVIAVFNAQTAPQTVVLTPPVGNWICRVLTEKGLFSDGIMAARLPTGQVSVDLEALSGAVLTVP